MNISVRCALLGCNYKPSYVAVVVAGLTVVAGVAELLAGVAKVVTGVVVSVACAASLEA